MAEIKELPVLIDSQTVQRLTGFHRRTVQNLARSGELPAKKVGTRWLYDTAAVLDAVGLGGAGLR